MYLADGKTRPATAGGGGIRVVDPETLANQVINKIERRAAQKWQGSRINDDRDPLLFNFQVVRVALPLDCKPVLEP